MAESSPSHQQLQHEFDRRPRELLQPPESQKCGPLITYHRYDVTETHDAGPSRGALRAAKLDLRLLSVCCCTILLSLVLVPAVNGNLVAVIVFGTPAGIAFIWSLAEAIELYIRDTNGFSPVTCIKFDLALCSAFMVSLFWMDLFGCIGHPESTLALAQVEHPYLHRALSCFSATQVYARKKSRFTESLILANDQCLQIRSYVTLRPRPLRT
ncbi:hypothetical protein ACJZ2D_011604 [Fusarium nematophilum]